MEHIERATIEDIPQLAELLKILFAKKPIFSPTGKNRSGVYG